MAEETPVWSPDGSRIVFSRGRYEPGAQSVVDRRIWLMNADGTDQRRLTGDAVEEFDPRWSRGGELVFSRVESRRIRPSWSSSGGLETIELYTARPDGSNLKRLTRTTPTEGRTRVVVRDVVRGRVVASAATVGEVGAVGVSKTTLAVLVDGFFGTRIELFDARSGRHRGGVAVPTSTLPELSVADRRVVFRTGPLGRVIRLLDARTMRQSTLALVKTAPVGLSIERNRVAWAENLAGRARIRAIVLPT